MNYLRIFITISFLMFAAGAGAEFYKYVDEDGSVRFTDDINQVPEAQRANIRSYVESESEELSEPEVAQESQANEATADQQVNSPDLSDSEQQSLEDTKKRLEQLKSEIDQEYEALLKEKEQLAKEKEQAKTKAQIIEYNKKIESMNQRIASYEKKGKAYKAEVDAYNERVTGRTPENQNQ